MSGGGGEEGIEKGIKKRFAEGGDAVVDVGAGGQAGEVDVAVGVGQVPGSSQVNGNSAPFTWAETAEEILGSLARSCQRISGEGHQ